MTDKARRRDGTEITTRELLLRIQHLLVGVLIGGLILGGAVVWGFVRQDRIDNRQSEQADQQIADRLEAREARCRKDDDDNAKHRRSIVDGGLTTGSASGEALIKTVTEAGRPADPKILAAYRANLQGIRPDLEGIANTFPGYRWDPKTETCVEVPMDTGG